MARRIINKKQKSLFAYCDYKGKLIQFHKDTGYLFSDNKSMDDCVNHFLSLDGFYLKENKKPVEKLVETKIETKQTVKKEQKRMFSREKKEE